MVGGDVFAHLVRTLGPYLGDVVFVGGWVQALYVLEAEGAGARVVRTSDIDVTLKSPLEAGDRAPLLDLLREGGFDVDAFDDASGFEISIDDVDVDLLTDAPTPGDPVRIEGQPDLRVFGYPHQTLLRENTRPMLVGPDVHESLTNPIEIKVPTLTAYVIDKVLSSSQRSNPLKRAKDLAYVSELMARETLVPAITGQMPELLSRHEEQGHIARDWLQSVLKDARLIDAVAEQLVESSGFDVADQTP